VRRQYGTIPTALTTQYTYFPWTTFNGQGRLQVLQTGTASTYDSRQKLAYTYDAVGNVMSITDYKAGGTQIQAFTYDTLDRLEKAQASGGTGGTYAQQTYTYDQLGNLTNNGNGTLTYGTQSAAPTCPDGALTKPHAVISGNGNTYCYDANGNQVRRTIGGAVSNLTYDAENRLTTVSGATSASFVYDGDGNRVKSVVNGVTTYHIGNHFEWRSTTGNMGRYYYADGQRIAMRYGSTVYYLLGDHLGSTTLTVTGSGAKYAEQRYYPWGDTRYPYWKTPTAYQFTGQYQDYYIKLYHMGARMYDPELGRFISPDSIVPDPANPQSLNRYAYVVNNPLKYRDPTGHWFETALDIAGIAWDIYDIHKNGLNWTSGLALTVDVVCLVVPIATGGGAAVRAVSKVDDIADTVRVVNVTGDAADAARAVDVPEFFNRTIDRAVTNPKGYTLRPSDLADGGLGLSTISDSVPPSTILQETGRPRLVQIPADNIPPGFQWTQTPGGYGKPILDNNHWELWNPNQMQTLSPDEYVNWWNSTVAPWLADRAANWTMVQ